MSEVIDFKYNPHPKQEEFHRAGEKYVLYGGAAGPGKSHAIRMDAITYAFTYPGSHVRLARRTVGDLRNSLFNPMLYILPPSSGSISIEPKHSDPPSITIKFHPTDRRYWSVISFLYWDNDGDYNRWQGSEFDYLGVDELTQFKPEWISLMLSRLRTSKKDKNGNPFPTYFRATANPGGVGHMAVKRRFIDPSPPGKAFLDENGISHKFIQAHLKDNPSLDIEQYRAQLMGLPDHLRRALLDGDWDVFEGQVFSMFQRTKEGKPWNVVRALPKGEYDFYVGFDWGYRDPASLAVVAKAKAKDFWGNRRTFVVANVYEKGKSPDWWGKMFKQVEEVFKPSAIWLPHDCFSRTRGDLMLVDVFKAESPKSNFKRASTLTKGSRKTRMNLMQMLFEAAQNVPENEGYPLLSIHERCTHAIRTIPELVYEDTGEGIKDGQEDHFVDSLGVALLHIEGKAAVLNLNDSEPFVFNRPVRKTRTPTIEIKDLAAAMLT